MSVSPIPIVRTVTSRPLLPLILVVALAVGVLVGVGAAYWRTHSRPEVTLVQAQASTTTSGALEVPVSAVVTDAGEQVVYVVVNDVVIRQPVHLASSGSRFAVVTSGLSPHAPVVSAPAGLHDGERVRTP